MPQQMKGAGRTSSLQQRSHAHSGKQLARHSDRALVEVGELHTLKLSRQPNFRYLQLSNMHQQP
jgi:hypothetical protein